MKLSEIKGERTFDVIADLIDPIAKIAADKSVAELFRREQLPKGESARAYAMKRIRASAPALLKNHKRELIEIMAVLEGKSASEYSATLTIPKLLSDVFSMLSDGELLALFGLAQTTAGTSSGAAQANTPEAEA